MASPYIFNMGQSGPYQPPSPFIPPANVLSTSPYVSPYSSPYRGTNPLPGGSPNMPNVPFPGAPNTPLHGYGEYPWERARRGSFNGGQNPYESTPNWLGATPMGGGHHRTRSFGEYNTYPPPQPNPYAGYWQRPPSPYANPGYLPPQSTFHIHPYLNGENPRGDFLFDLSSPKFAPLRFVGPGQTEYVPPDELAQSATWPSINQLRIICDSIPQWPIDITIDSSYYGGASPPPGAKLPPITLGDILFNIHNNLGQRISHADWVSLAPEQETAIGRAYTQRCKALGSAEAVERSQGVKRIDYCMGKVWFNGLTRVGDGMEVLKLHLKRK